MSGPNDIRTCPRCGLRRIARQRSAKLCFDCLYERSGPLPLMVDEPTPCYKSPAFFELESLVENAVGDGIGDGRRLARTVERAAEPICGQCPVKAECLQRMQGGRYTGVAGGRLITGGRLRPSRDSKRKEVA